jgi:hypothetical protein
MKRRIFLSAAAAIAYATLAFGQSITPQIGGGISKGFDGGVTGPSIPSFTPSQIPNMIGWWKADSGVFSNTAGTTPAVNGGSVARVNDNSASAANLLQTPGAQPIYAAAAQNGLPALSTNNTNFAYMAAAAFPMTATTGLTVIVVMKIVSYSAFDRVISYGNGADNTAGEFIAPIMQSATSVQDVSSVNGSISTITTGFNQVYSIWDGTNNTIYVGNVGATPVAQAPTFLANQEFRIMANVGSGNAMNGLIGEVIVYNRALNSTERGKINAYLLARWGV